MITLILSIIVLLIGYFVYSKYIERVFGADGNRPTPAITMTDGVDYMPMPWWKVFLIQFLNIAGLGPIFGAVAGAMWGPVAYLWIILGSVFAGAVHYFSFRMLSNKSFICITNPVLFESNVAKGKNRKAFTAKDKFCDEIMDQDISLVKEIVFSDRVLVL